MTLPDHELRLASTSPYKIALFERLGLPFETVDSGVEEIEIEHEKPDARAARLSLEKAEAASTSSAYVVAGDQVICLGDRVFHKPNTAENAVEQLLSLAGKTHRLICACTVISPNGDARTESVVYEMAMRPLTRDEAETYVDYDQPLDCAGSYKLESRGIGLFRSMIGDDHTAIIGLPLTRVRKLLEDLGYFGE